MPKESTTRRATVRRAGGSAGLNTLEKVQILTNTCNHRTPANDPRNRGEKIPGWGFDPNWVNGSLMMASLVFDAAKPVECPLQL